MSGTVPTELGQLLRVQVLALACNALSGALPNAPGDVGRGLTGADGKTLLYLQGNSRLRFRTAHLPASLAAA